MSSGPPTHCWGSGTPCKELVQWAEWWLMRGKAQKGIEEKCHYYYYYYYLSSWRDCTMNLKVSYCLTHSTKNWSLNFSWFSDQSKFRSYPPPFYATVSCPRKQAGELPMNLFRHNCWGSGTSTTLLLFDNWPFLVNIYASTKQCRGPYQIRGHVLPVLSGNKAVPESDKANHQFHISCLMAGMCKTLLRVRIPASNILRH